MKLIVFIVLTAIISLPTLFFMTTDIIVTWEAHSYPHKISALMFYITVSFCYIFGLVCSISSYRDDKKHAASLKEWEEKRITISEKQCEGAKKLMEKAKEIRDTFKAAVLANEKIKAELDSFQIVVHGKAFELSEMTRLIFETEANEEMEKYNKLIEEFPDFKVDFARFFINEISNTLVEPKYTNCISMGINSI